MLVVVMVVVVLLGTVHVDAIGLFLNTIACNSIKANGQLPCPPNQNSDCCPQGAISCGQGPSANHVCYGQPSQIPESYRI